MNLISSAGISWFEFETDAEKLVRAPQNLVDFFRVSEEVEGNTQAHSQKTIVEFFQNFHKNILTDELLPLKGDNLIVQEKTEVCHISIWPLHRLLNEIFLPLVIDRSYRLFPNPSQLPKD